MTKNLKLTYILLFIFSAILIAFKTLSNFFGGVGLNFIALIGLIFAILLISLKDKSLMKRIKDLFILTVVFASMELIMYFACEFGNGECIKGFSVYQNIISFLGILFLAYTAFRFSIEYLDKKFKFIEILLGNEKRSIKPKKAKEITNGCLEEKPNHTITKTEQSSSDENEEENVVIIETEEEE